MAVDTVVVHPVEDGRLEEWVALLNLAYPPFPASADAVRLDDSLRPPGEPWLRLSALRAERLVGLARARLSHGGSRLYDRASATVVVHPDARREGIGRLTLLATRYARDHGIPRIHTDNNLINVGMLALNRELGFRPGPMQLIYEKRVVEGA